VLNTVSGTAHLLKKLGGNPNEWITRITSPAGTTIEGIKVLEEKALKGIVMECLRATTNRAKELGKE
jgi:pyrroline-5-carboxylate reductase